jgi:uncharacterized Zn finger protein
MTRPRRGDQRARPATNPSQPRAPSARTGHRPAPRPSHARPPAAGVRRSVGERWWTARWLAALERLGWSRRLQEQGEALARAGRVIRIDVQPGQVSATVKGARPKLERVSIRLTPLTDAEWERVTDALAAHALFAAWLLAGEMPPTIEDAFAEAGVTLFPLSASELSTACTCGGGPRPCKHIAAVYAVLGAEFDHDPFLLVWLRGRSRSQLLQALRAKRGAGAPAPPPEPPPAPGAAEAGAMPAPPLAECIDRFWQPGIDLDPAQFRVERPEVPESVLRRLGPPPFWRGSFDVMPVLVDAYRTISREAYALAHPEKPVERPPAALPAAAKTAPRRRRPRSGAAVA